MRYGGLDGFTRYVRGPVREELLERFESLHLPSLGSEQ